MSQASPVKLNNTYPWGSGNECVDSVDTRLAGPLNLRVGNDVKGHLTSVLRELVCLGLSTPVSGGLAVTEIKVGGENKSEESIPGRAWGESWRQENPAGTRGVGLGSRQYSLPVPRSLIFWEMDFWGFSLLDPRSQTQKWSCEEATLGLPTLLPRDPPPPG